MNTKVLSQIKQRDILQKNLIGLEREGLRVKESGCIATTPHPKNFGSPLTNTIITTDFAESLVEIVTPPLVGANKTLDFLEKSLHFVYKNLEHNEKFWPASMPSIIRGKTEIKIAKYGTSNQAKMKEIYRTGLANRYGSAMQIVAGIHFNYSFSDNFWKNFKQIVGDKRSLRVFKDDKYMHLIRNILRYDWVLYYYFGASNSVCKSFLHNYHQHDLIHFDNNTLYQPHATSLRMGDIGYQNLVEDEAGVKANYNSVIQYAHSLQDAMQTPCHKYQKFATQKNGIYQQLNANILQIENEYYSSVRPKPKINNEIMPSISLIKNGIEYIELRSIDINPLNYLGIDEDQILFLESFLLFCLLENSKSISSTEQVIIDKNNNQVAHNGLNKNLNLINNNKTIPLNKWLNKITKNIKKCASVFDDKHYNALINITKKKSPSSLIIQKMINKNQGFNSFINNLAIEYKSYFLAKKIDKNHFKKLENQALLSIIKTKKLENNTLNFKEFLTNYFNQL